MSKRDSYISWDEYFMISAGIAAERSKDCSTQVGCTIVNQDKRVVASGYNGLCKGFSDDGGYWAKGNDDPMKNKYAFVVHAESNALISAKKDCSGCSLYVTHMPCNECAKLIVQSGITKVVYVNEWEKGKDTSLVSKILFEKGGVVLEKYTGRTQITIDI